MIWEQPIFQKKLKTQEIMEIKPNKIGKTKAYWPPYYQILVKHANDYAAIYGSSYVVTELGFHFQ